MAEDTQPMDEVLETHSNGADAVRIVQTKDGLYYAAFSPDTLGLGVYDSAKQAGSAARWASELLEEQPNLRRLTLMQLIVEKLRLQYPDDTAEVTLGPTGE